MQPTPVFLPGESHGHRSLAGYSLQGRRVRHNDITAPKVVEAEKNLRNSFRIVDHST